ncbi:hypothetical protein [Desulfomicrobium salsuginis]
MAEGFHSRSRVAIFQNRQAEAEQKASQNAPETILGPAVLSDGLGVPARNKAKEGFFRQMCEEADIGRQDKRLRFVHFRHVRVPTIVKIRCVHVEKDWSRSPFRGLF